MHNPPRSKRLASQRRLLSFVILCAGYASSVNVVALNDISPSGDFPQGFAEGRANIPTAAIGLGSVLALALCRLGDRWGRRKAMVVCVAGGSAMTGLTALSSSSTTFVLSQMGARAFLAAVFVVAAVMIVEEFPATRRGFAVGRLVAFGALGLPLAAAAHMALPFDDSNWRFLYLIGALPLLFLPFIARSVQETTVWEKLKGQHHGLRRKADLAPLLQAGGLFFLINFALFAGAGWFTFLASQELDFSRSTTTGIAAAALGAGIPGYFVSGYLQDRFGRKRTGTLLMICAALLGATAFQMRDVAPMAMLLAAASFCGFGLTPLANTLVGEMFPTGARALALGISRSVFGTLGAVVGPALVGVYSYAREGAIADGVSLSAFALLVAIWILRRMPETAGRQLDSIAHATTAERFLVG